jgi:nucleotide-binding universal stress UspA family protein
VTIFPTKILLATDGSEDAAHATEAAVELAKISGSELHVVYVGKDAYSEALAYPESTDPGWVEQEDPVLIQELGQQFEQIARRILDAEVEKVQAAGGTVAQAHLRMGTAATEITDLAEEMSAGLLVVGSRGLGGIRRALVGSVSDAVARHAHCPVLIVRNENQR